MCMTDMHYCYMVVVLMMMMMIIIIIIIIRMTKIAIS